MPVKVEHDESISCTITSMNKNTILFFMVFVVFAGAIIWFYEARLERQQRDFQAQLQQTLNKSSGNQRKQKDPYLSNQVKNTIIKHLREVQVCYNQFTSNSPKITDGRLKLDWTINEEGKVIQPEIISSPFESKDFHICVINSIKKWTFPKPPFGQEKYVQHSFNFKFDPEKKS